MKLSNFLFPESRDPALDGRVIDEAIAEAKLGRLKEAREHFVQAKPLWRQVPEGKNLKPEVTQGTIWIESMEDMSALRSEAEKLLDAAGAPKSGG